ncbi:MAG: PQQ-like beta-propeller repeat protein [Acidobacteria bacterium]|nr:PQQ-like beta-propeller repeat protein [Acidobacteriota bacterium]
MIRLSSTLCAVLAVSVAHAQRGGNDWMTIGNDAQRSYWLRGDAKISQQTMRKPGFEMVWKMKLKNTARQQQSLTPPALLDFYISYRGFRTLGFYGGSGDTVIGVDTDLARLEWQNGAGTSNAPAGTAACPGGMTTSVTRPTQTPYPPNFSGRGFGRANPAKSGVGEPFAGAVTLRAAATPRPAGPPPVPAAKPGRRQATPINPFGRTPLYVNSITGDGLLHQMYVSNGEEPKLPLQFLPAGAHSLGLTVFDGTAYVATTNGCNGVENGIWAIDLDSQKVVHWKATGKNVEGTTGYAVGPEGEIYVASGNQIVALAEKTLEQRAAYAAGSADFVSSPVVFEFKGKNLIAAATADGRVHVIDSANMTAAAKSDTVAKPGYAVGALASWEDEYKVRWILVPAGSAIASLKVVEDGGSVALQKGWNSKELTSPITPTIVNGVVFAASSGNAGGTEATLFAFEGSTGKELWNSGTTIGSYITTGGLSAGGGRVYVSTIDGTQYAFGFPMEH